MSSGGPVSGLRGKGSSESARQSTSVKLLLLSPGDMRSALLREHFFGMSGMSTRSFVNHSCGVCS